MSDEPTPIFATVIDLRERLKNCASCEHRREIIQRWFVGEKLRTLGVRSPFESVPRDMSILKQEK